MKRYSRRTFRPEEVTSLPPRKRNDRQRWINNLEPRFKSAPGESYKPLASNSEIASAIEVLRRAKRPLVIVGKGAAGIAAGALEKGMPPSSVVASDTCDEAIPKLIELLIDGDGVLVKGSRSARMERVVEALIEHKNPGGNL